jgi:hypothetical protein
MTFDGFVLVRGEKLIWERKSQLTKVCCSTHGFKKSVNSLNGPAWKLPQLVSELRDLGFTPLLEPSVIHAMGKIANADKGKTAWVDDQMASMEAATGNRFRSYQVEDARWMASVDSGILALEQRLGKSCTVLTQVREPGGVIICPLAAIELVWGAHVRDWLPWMKFTPITKFRWPKSGEIVCMNYERLMDDPGDAPSGVTIIIDECHYVRTPTATRTRRCRAVVASAMRSKGRAWGLTGTPAPNGRPEELWALLELIQVGKKMFGDKKSFQREMLANWSNSGARGRIASVILRRLRSQVASQVPPATWKDWHVPMSDLESEVLESMNRLWKLAQERGLDVGDPKELIKALHHDPEFHEISRIRASLAEAKIPLAQSWVEEMEEAGERCVIISAHRIPVLYFGTRPGWGLIIGGDDPGNKGKRKAVVDAFHRGELKGLALTVGAGGTAINLDCADNLLFVDRDWVPGNNAQACDRVVSTDEKTARSKFFTRMIVDHPLEHRVEEVLSGKMMIINQSIDSLGAGGGETEGDRARRILADVQIASGFEEGIDRDRLGSVLDSITVPQKASIRLLASEVWDGTWAGLH